MEGWEELNPEEKAELASVFSGHLHDLVVSADVEFLLKPSIKFYAI